MKNIIINFIFISIIACFTIGCNDWTEVEYLDPSEQRPKEYYEALREWKLNTDHQVTFGWFGNWTGVGASTMNCLMGLPDSVDFVSMWGNWHSFTPEKWADKNKVKQLKGTRVLMCLIVANIGDQLTPSDVTKEYVREDGTKYYEVGGVKYDTEEMAIKAFWGWDDNDQTKIDAAIVKYAKSIVDSVHKYEYDGFDFDYEPSYSGHGNIAGPNLGNNGDPEKNSTRINFLTFVKELGKYMGPKSGTDLMLVIDGEPQNMHPDARDYFDYYIIQSYDASSHKSLDVRYDRLISGLKAGEDRALKEEVTKKLIWTETFEDGDNALNGGTKFTTRDGEKIRSLKGLALWQSLDGFRHGGVGTYHMEYEYDLSPKYGTQYPHLREVSTIMNPPMISFDK